MLSGVAPRKSVSVGTWQKAGAWNQIMTQTQLDNGIPDNPDILARSIMAVSGYFVMNNSDLPHDYGRYTVEKGVLRPF